MSKLFTLSLGRAAGPSGSSPARTRSGLILKASPILAPGHLRSENGSPGGEPNQEKAMPASGNLGPSVRNMLCQFKCHSVWKTEGFKASVTRIIL